MSAKGDQLAEIALSFQGTRFWPNGREPGRGLDCAGLVICSLWAMSIECPNPDYHLGAFHDHFDLMRGCLADVFEQAEPPLEVGDVLAMRLPRIPNHMAVYIGSDQVVHAVTGRDVRTTVIDHSLNSRIESVWRLK